MKYKLIGITVVAAVLAVTIGMSLVTSDEETGRFIEHLDAEQKTPCTDCTAELCTHLPIVKIDTQGKDIPGEVILNEAGGHTIDYTKSETGEDTIVSQIEIVDNSKEFNHTEDSPKLSTKAKIRIRGNSSRHFEKKGYFLDFITDTGENNPQEVMGMDAHHEWALHGPYLDRTLIRNYMCYSIAGQIMDYAPNVRFCEVIINGEYNGLYLMTETVTAGKDGARLSLSVNKKDNTFSGYLLRVDRGSETELKNINSFSEYTHNTGSRVNIEYPGTANLNETLARNIRDDFSAFEKALFSYDYDDEKYGYENFIDEQSFIDYFIFNEFASNYDAAQYSTYIYKGTDGKFRLCVWDFNNAFDNYQENETSYRQFALQGKLWYSMLFCDEDFTEKVIARYKELEKLYLNEEYINEFIDGTITYLGDAIDRNYEKWGHIFTPEYDRLFDFHRNHHSYETAVLQLKEYAAHRCEWMSENIETLRQYSAESKVKQHNY